MKPYEYTLTIKNKSINEIRDKANNKVRYFDPVLTAKKKTSKIYVLKIKKDVLYIGQTIQSMRTRLTQGLHAKGKNGYHGYKWKNNEDVKLYVFCFQKMETKKLESIEAELVFLVRNNTGKWALAQNEIHFNNNFEEAKKIAFKIYNQILTVNQVI